MASKNEPRLLSREEFAVAMAPIYRVCREENGATDRSRAEVAETYYAILSHVPARFLRAAVVAYLRAATEPWFPMPAVLLGLARIARSEWRQKQRDAAPDCPYCVRSGLVDARPRGSAKWECFDCICVHAATESSRRFDPASMETYRSHTQKLLTEHGPAKRLLSPEAFAEHFSIPEPVRKSAGQQRQELRRLTAEARKAEHRRVRSAEIELLRHAEARAAERMAVEVEV